MNNEYYDEFKLLVDDSEYDLFVTDCIKRATENLELAKTTLRVTASRNLGALCTR